MVWWWCGLEGVIHGRVEQAAALDAVGVGEQPRLDGGELRLVGGVGGGGGGDGRLCLVLEGGRGRRRCGQGRAAVGHLGGFRRAGRALGGAGVAGPLPAARLPPPPPFFRAHRRASGDVLGGEDVAGG